MNRSTPAAGVIVLETACVAAGTALFVSARSVQPYMWAGVALLAASFVVRRLQSGRFLRRTPLDGPWLLFLASALIGVWAAYDRPAAWVKLLLIVAGATLYYLLASRAHVQWFALAMVLALSLAGAALALYGITQFDYSSQPGKLALVTRLGQLINSLIAHPAGYQPHPNIAAAVLEVVLPLSLAATLGTRRELAGRLRTLLSVAFMLCSLVMVAGLLMGVSRGAWLALATVAVAGVAIALLLRTAPPERQAPLLIAGLLGCGAVLAAVLLLGGDTAIRLLGAIPGGERAIGRGELYGQAASLIRDYTVTGSGLGMFPMVFSTYTLLIWVPFLTHAHNLFLQLWIEQGLLGIVALIWLIVAFYAWAWRRRHRLGWLAAAGAIAASVMLVHGLVDVGLYASRALPLMVVPLGLAMGDRGQGSGVGVQEAGGRQQGAPLRTAGQAGSGWVVVAGVAVLLLVLSFVWRGRIAGMWYANLGSVAETQAELKGYAFPERLVDYVRHDGDLSEAESYFRQALSHDPSNITAGQRLALIALGRGQHEQAQAYLASLPQQDIVTRQLLCEAYVGAGKMNAAQAACSGVPGAASRLDSVAVVRYERNKDTQRAAWARAVAENLFKQGKGGQ